MHSCSGFEHAKYEFVNVCNFEMKFMFYVLIWNIIISWIMSSKQPIQC